MLDCYIVYRSSLDLHKLVGAQTWGSSIKKTAASLRPFGISWYVANTAVAAMGQQEQHKLVAEIFKCWKANEDLCRRAATGKLANVAKPKALTRRDVSINVELLTPILQYIGT